MSLGKRLFELVRANLTDVDPTHVDDVLSWDPADADAALAAPSEPELFTTQELQWFRDLQLEPGADRDAIRRAYRQQMRTFHPDRFVSDPAKFEVATQVARGLTEAYNGLLRRER